jgi:hypothetical protein
MTTSFAPHLFVKNIAKTVSKQDIHNVFQNCGFGIIQDIIVRQRNGTAIVVYEKWNMDETMTTRNMLENGKSLTIVCDELDAVWKASAYNTNMDRFEHLFVDSKLHPNITDNRKQRAKNNRWVDKRCFAPTKAVRDENQRYAEEFLRDISVKLF